VHLTTNPIDWYAARAGGVVAYVLLTAVVVLGLTMAGKKKLRVWPRFAVEDVHRFGGLLVGTFVSIHVLAIAIDAFLPFSLQSIIVPFISVYRPIWVGLGIVAAELLLALAVANHYRNKLVSYKFWRRTHYLNFVVWTAVTLHLLGSGTDRSTWWLLGITTVAVAAVAGATALRVTKFRPSYAPLVAGGVGAVVVLALGLGPLRFHARPWNASTFHDSLNGQIVQNFGPTRGVLSLAASGTGGQNVLVRADLLITPRKILSTSFQMEYLPSGLVCKGKVTATHGMSFNARCRTSKGDRRVVTASWQPGETSQLQGGVLDVRALGGGVTTPLALDAPFGTTHAWPKPAAQPQPPAPQSYEADDVGETD
jgi:sulfoxide reductase heme-binding subunit YedZ